MTVHLFVRIPPCGHLYCADFMGCTEEANRRMGLPVLHPSPFFVPGQDVEVRVLQNTGFAHLDWDHEWRSR